MPSHPKQPDERLSWTGYNAYAQSNGGLIQCFDIQLLSPPTYRELIELAYSLAQFRAVAADQAWDPFNARITIRPK